ncbi:MAG: hypothetical protein M3O30_14345 [Planctomycetota bacterium]|nr:hypothetical protein [Planctomycetota bacterium]
MNLPLRLPLIASAKRHEIDAQFYLRSVLAHLPTFISESADEMKNYLPDVWKRDLMAEQQTAMSAHHAKLVQAIIR